MRMADLEQELSLTAELQDLAVAWTGGGEPHVVVVIDHDAMHAVRPAASRRIGAWTAVCWPIVLKRRARASPRLHHVTAVVELDDVRSFHTAFAERWIGLAVKLVGPERLRAVRDPNVLFGIDVDSNDSAGDPVVRQRFGERLVVIEERHFALVVIRRGARP